MFSFEGIGLVSVSERSFRLYFHLITVQIVPITDSMREPRKFPMVLTGVMAFLLGGYSCVLFEVVVD